MSEIITKKQSNVKNTCLCIKFFENITDELDNIIPYPHRHFFHQNSIVYCWLIDGFFKTKKNIEYLNDIIARFKLTFNCQLFNYKTTNNNNNPYRLKLFQNLKSKVEKIKDYGRADTHFDNVFFMLKFYAEDLIKEDGFIIYQKLEDFAIKNFLDTAKDFSTLKAKCRSIFNWYLERDWKIGRDKQKYYNLKQYQEATMASRVEHMKKVNEKRKKETDKKIKNCIYGMFKDEYKKKNGKWNISKIAKDTGLHRNTVYNYLKENNI